LVKCHDALLGGVRATALIYVKRGGRTRSQPRRDPPGPRKDASAGLGRLAAAMMLIGLYRRAELFRDRRPFLGDIPTLLLGLVHCQLLLNLKHLFDECTVSSRFFL